MGKIKKQTKVFKLREVGKEELRKILVEKIMDNKIGNANQNAEGDVIDIRKLEQEQKEKQASKETNENSSSNEEKKGDDEPVYEKPQVIPKDFNSADFDILNDEKKEEKIKEEKPKEVSQPKTRNISYLRQLEKTTSILSKITMISVFAVVGSFCTVLAMFPLKKTETVFVSLKSGEQLVRLLPEQVDRTVREQYIRTVLFEYIKKRETINFVDEAERFSWLQSFTHPAWYKLFAEHMSSSNENSPLVYYSKNELTRDVSVLTLEQIPGTDNVWRAEFIATDRKAGVNVRTKTFVATFKAYTTSVQSNNKKMQNNPFGLIVESYAISEKMKPNTKGF